MDKAYQLWFSSNKNLPLQRSAVTKGKGEVVGSIPPKQVVDAVVSESASSFREVAARDDAFSEKSYVSPHQSGERNEAQQDAHRNGRRHRGTLTSSTQTMGILPGPIFSRNENVSSNSVANHRIYRGF